MENNPLEIISTKEKIFQCAIKLFCDQGYKATTVREIAVATGLSLGNVSYHYKAKSDLAEDFIIIKKTQILNEIDKFLSYSSTPMAASAAVWVMLNAIFTSEKLIRLYVDTMEEEIYTNVMNRRGLENKQLILNAFKKDNLSEDCLIMYSVFLANSTERTLILGKEKGLFKTIDYENIPSVEYSVAYAFHENKDFLNSQYKVGELVAHTILKDNPYLFDPFDMQIRA